MRRNPQGMHWQGLWYCQPDCLERALLERLHQAGPLPEPRINPHRVPLGLLMLSRQEITVSQLRTALHQQKSVGHGKIGEWLQDFGFVNEQQVVAALARQWSCPVWRGDSRPAAAHLPEIPVLLLESFRMMPVSFVPATSTLHVAFAEGIAYSALYAIEQLLACRTEPCLISPTLLNENLLQVRERKCPTQIEFDHATGDPETARIIRSYAYRVSASEIRLAFCGSHLWVRIEHSGKKSLDLTFRSSSEYPEPQTPPHDSPAVPVPGL